MSRSRINGNFIDKNFSIVAKILLQIIPTSSGEKEAFIYYQDGVSWFSLLFSFLVLLLVLGLGEKHKPTLVEGEVCLEIEQFLLSCIPD